MSFSLDSPSHDPWCKCPRCNIQMEYGVCECPNCGNVLSQMEVDEAETQFKHQRTKEILFGVVFFAVFFGGLIWYFGKM